jgi:RNA polymerase sigma-70 factor, ECF subfamily
VSLIPVRPPERQPPVETDPEILRRAQAGDEAAFGDLVRAHYEAIFRLVVSIVRDEHEARDVCQEVWLAVWKHLKEFRGEARFTTWLHPIAVRRAVDHLRRRQRWYARFLPFLARDGDGTEAADEPATGALALDSADASDPRRDLEKAERERRFERALASLPPKHRAVLALREVEGLSYAEIAKTINCRPGTVMSRLFHARRLLVRKLGDLPCD